MALHQDCEAPGRRRDRTDHSPAIAPGPQPDHTNDPRIAPRPYPHTGAGPDFGLHDRVVIVTGAGSGIGRATTIALAEAGALVVLAGRRAAALEQTAAHLDSTRCLLARCDVGEEQQVARLAAQTHNRFGQLDAAFNNAGIFGSPGLLHEDTVSNFEAIVATNLRGLWACLKHELAAMLDSAGGSIVNAASVAAHLGHAQSPVYAATKHAVVGISKSAALQYAHADVRVNVVSPGSTETDLLTNLYPRAEERAMRAARAPLRRLGQPEDVASAALWLMSPLSGYVTGQVLIVDGGVTAGSTAPGAPHQRPGPSSPPTRTSTQLSKLTTREEASRGCHPV
jgi:A-factor type gamma-butyrolactone 1'-reductase (1S-forming)